MREFCESGPVFSYTRRLLACRRPRPPPSTGRRSSQRRVLSISYLQLMWSLPSMAVPSTGAAPREAGHAIRPWLYRRLPISLNINHHLSRRPSHGVPTNPPSPRTLFSRPPTDAPCDGIHVSRYNRPRRFLAFVRRAPSLKAFIARTGSGRE
jgi:hypothetical protein